MRKNLKFKLLICTLAVIILSISFCIPKSHAIGEIFAKGRDFLEKGDPVDSKLDEGALKSTSDFIYNTLLAIAIVIAVIMAMILGIKFMTGSVEEKVKVKEALVPFVVGLIVVFGAFTIWKIAVNIGNRTEMSATGGGSGGTAGGSSTPGGGGASAGGF